MRPLTAGILSLVRILPLLIPAGALPARSAIAQTEVDRPQTEELRETEGRIILAFAESRTEDALELIDRALTRWPEVPELHYDRACALSLLGRREAAGESLLLAVRRGFRDFDTMRLDPALRPMRNHDVFRAILDASGRAAEPAADLPGLEALRQRFDDDYHFESIETLRVHLACGLPRRSCLEMRAMLERQSRYQLSNLFAVARPEWCTIVIPAPRDQGRVFKEDLNLDDPDRTPGAYRHDRRLLVSRDIGGSMRHEYTHRLHWADMEARRQRHPMWIQEGMASLFEDYEWTGNAPTFIPNLRHAIVHRQVSSGRAMEMARLFALGPDAFQSDRASLYPQVRSVFEFIADSGHLESWYRSYVDGYDRDRSGRRAMESVFGRSLQQVDDLWRRWVLDRGRREAALDLGDPYPGILVANAGDGVRVERIATTEARRAGLRVGDVLMKIDEDAVRTTAAWYMALANRRNGDVVRLEYRRRGSVKVVRVRLHPFGSR